MEEEAVHIKVFDKKGDVVFEGMVSSYVTPRDLLGLGCFRERGARNLCVKSSNDLIATFKGFQSVDLVVDSSGLLRADFSGVLHVGKDGVFRKSATVPFCECAILSVWNLSHEECEKVFYCDSLTELEIFQCGLREVPRGIGKMKRLKKLVAQGLKMLSSIAEEIGTLLSLKELWLESCGIESLPKSIGDMERLEKLMLRYLFALKSVPEEFGHLSSLKELVIWSCGIDTLPKSIVGLKQLEKLSLNYLEGLKTVPEEVGELTSLKELEIGGCRIETLPKTIVGLKQLEKLALMNLEGLKSVPEEVGRLSSLKELRIWRCSVGVLPKSLRELKFLTSLDLCKLENLELCPEDLSVFSNLEILCVKSCVKLFSALVPSWNPLAAFCEVLKMSVKLRFLEWDWKLQEDRAVVVAALQENGSIVEGRGDVSSGLEGIFIRNRENHERAKASVVRMLAIRRWRRGMSDFPNEMVEMMAKMLWISRGDLEGWRVETLL